MNVDTVEYFRRAIEYAPREPGPMAPNLIGWTTPNGLYLCARCAARIMARGCYLPMASEPVWKDGKQGECCCCVS
jgi:hypothetical protein